MKSKEKTYSVNYIDALPKVLKGEKVSIPYFQRKYNLTYAKAKELYEEFFPNYKE